MFFSIVHFVLCCTHAVNGGRWDGEHSSDCYRSVAAGIRILAGNEGLAAQIWTSLHVPCNSGSLGN